jgi:hypothetical protein
MVPTAAKAMAVTDAWKRIHFWFFIRNPLSNNFCFCLLYSALQVGRPHMAADAFQELLLPGFIRRARHGQDLRDDH